MASHFTQFSVDGRNIAFVVDFSAVQLLQRPALELCGIPASPKTPINCLLREELVKLSIEVLRQRFWFTFMFC